MEVSALSDSTQNLVQQMALRGSYTQISCCVSVGLYISERTLDWRL